jgi:hypothetical protein
LRGCKIMDGGEEGTSWALNKFLRKIFESSITFRGQ